MIQTTHAPPHLLDSARWAGLRVGLLGGSFNPPHEGHVHVSLTALRMLELDFIWWQVTPQNPFKDSGETIPLEDRMALCRDFSRHPQILVTDIESQIGAARSYDTLLHLRTAFSHTDFVWVTGMDIAHEFHLWHRWRDILKLTATAHIARPPFQAQVQDCPLRKLETQNHHVLNHAGKHPLAPGHSYWILDCRMLEIASSQIRNSI